MCVCVCGDVFMYVYVCMYVCMHMETYMCAYVWLYVCLRMCVFFYVACCCSPCDAHLQGWGSMTSSIHEGAKRDRQSEMCAGTHRDRRISTQR